MSDSPYISEPVKEYLKKYQLEQELNTLVNSLLRTLPPDPFSYLAASLAAKAVPDITILSVKGCETIVEGAPQMLLFVKALYLQREYLVQLNHRMASANEDSCYLFDQDRFVGKGLKKAEQFINTELKAVLEQANCVHQQDLDKKLDALYMAKKKGLTQVTMASLLPFYLKEAITLAPLYRAFEQKFLDKDESPSKMHQFKVIVNALQGSKQVGSKCKAWRYYLLQENVEDVSLLINISAAIRKAITSGKGGEAALKLHTDGTFICPLDTIADNLKLVEDAINSSGGKDKVTVGICWQAQLFYNPDQKKYELENPKQLLDIDQLIDYYFKLCTDRPMVSYLEDAVPGEDLAAWAKLQAKFKGSKVRLGTRKLYSTEEGFRNAALPVDRAQKPELTEEQIAQLNGKKVLLQMGQLRPFQKATMSQVISHVKLLLSKRVEVVLMENATETTDTTLVDLSVELQQARNKGQLDVSGPVGAGLACGQADSAAGDSAAGQSGDLSILIGLMDKALLEERITKMTNQPNLEEVIKRQLRDKENKSKNYKNYFLNALAHKYFSRMGLLPTAQDSKFKHLIEQFSSIHTFINIKDLVQNLNVLNENMLDYYQNFEKYCDNSKGRERQMFETARTLEIQELPLFEEQRENSKRLQLYYYGRTVENNRSYSRMFESKLEQINIGSFFDKYQTDQDYQFQKFYNEKYEELVGIKEEERVIDEDNEISPALQLKLKKYKEKVMARMKAQKDPSLFFNEFKKKANHLQNKMGKILGNLVAERRSPQGNEAKGKKPTLARALSKDSIKGTEVRYPFKINKSKPNRLQREQSKVLTARNARQLEQIRSEREKDRRPTSKDKERAIKTSDSHEYDFKRKSEQYNFRSRKTKGVVLKKIANLIGSIQNSKYIFSKEKEAYQAFLNKVIKNVQDEMNAFCNLEVLKIDEAERSRTKNHVLKKILKVHHLV